MTILAALTAPGCGGSSGGGAPIVAAPAGSVLSGSVKIESSTSTIRSHLPPDRLDAEPNSTAFDAQDIGDLAAPQTLVGEVGRGTDRFDYFRAGPIRAGAVDVDAHGFGLQLVILRLPGGSGPAIPVYRGVAGSRSVDVNEGDHLVVGLGGSEPTAYDFSLARGQRSTARAPELDSSVARAVHDAWLAPDSELVPGEIVIVPEPGEESRQLATLARMGFRQVEHGGGIYRLRFDGRLVDGDSDREDDLGHTELADALFEIRRTLPGLQASPNFVRHPLVLPNDPKFLEQVNGKFFQWGLRLTKVPEAWDVAKGQGIVIGVIDGGILRQHPDLKDKILPDGYDFDNKDADPQQSDAEGKADDWHSSHVSGIAAASTNNGQGIAGVAWESKILAVQAEKSDFEVAQGILYCAGLDNSSGRKPANPANIISMSFGGSVPGAACKAAIDKVRAAGTILVAAGGNSGDSHNSPEWPAAYEGVIAVAAVNPAGLRAVYSNSGAYIDIAAPGGSGTSQDPVDQMLSAAKVDQGGTLVHGYRAFVGTSQATPFISGTIALMLSANTKLKYEQVMNILASTATEKGAAGRDPLYGVGLVNVEDAVKQANRGLILTADRQSIQPLSTDQTSAFEIKLTNGGTTAGEIDGLKTKTTTSATSWLAARVSQATTPAVLTVTFDRSKMASGTEYNGAVRVESNGGGQVRIPVLSRMLPPKNTQPVTIILADDKGQVINGADGKPKYTTTAKADGTYSLPGIPKGEYVLMAGIDENKDGKFDDAGDWTIENGVSFGDDPVKITLDGTAALKKDLNLLHIHKREFGKF